MSLLTRFRTPKISATPLFITASFDGAVGNEYAKTGPITGAAWNTNGGAANKVVGFEFFLNENVVVTALAFYCGSAPGVADPFDVGIYDNAFARLISTGSTTRTVTNGWQSVDVTDTRLTPGHYYMFMSSSDANNNNMVFWYGAPASGVAVSSFMGILDSSTAAFPLPNPITNIAAASSFTAMPMFGAHCNTGF